MKITDIKITLFRWEGIPDTKYVQGVGGFGGISQLGLVEIITDDGIIGRSFLGSAVRGAHFDAQSLVDTLKPVLLGQDPLDREKLYRAIINAHSEKMRKFDLNPLNRLGDISEWRGARDASPEQRLTELCVGP
jgi:L-alanine-DL-glutamate epimerase-like enolase superfamily enzyme